MIMGKLYVRQLMTICIVAIMVLWYGSVLAQTLSTNAPADQKAWEMILKIVFPAIWTGVAPWITSLITKGIGGLPASVKVAISTVLGTIMAGVAGSIPDFPLTIESAATMGAAGGGTGQILYNMTPPSTKPKDPTT
jgi:hypothetical protein